MSSQELEGFKTSVEDLALDELSRLQGELAVLNAALTENRAAMKAVRTILAATRPASLKQAKKAKKQSSFSISGERYAVVVAWLDGYEGELTAKMLYEHTGWSSSYCNMVMKFLREQGTIRLAATSGSQHIYRSMA